jgi:hypothetical protein
MTRIDGGTLREWRRAAIGAPTGAEPIAPQEQRNHRLARQFSCGTCSPANSGRPHLKALAGRCQALA